MKIALATPEAASTVQPDYRRKPRRASPTLQSGALGHEFCEPMLTVLRPRHWLSETLDRPLRVYQLPKS